MALPVLVRLDISECVYLGDMERFKTLVPSPFPWFKFSPSDWLTSVAVRLMTIAEEGAYHRLLCEAWEQPDCGLPNDDRTLGILSRLGDDWPVSRDLILEQFELRDGRWFNLRLLDERKDARSRSKKTEKANRVRWGRSKESSTYPQRILNVSLDDPQRVPRASVSECISVSVLTTESKQTAEEIPDLNVWADGIYNRWKKYRDRVLALQALCQLTVSREAFEATYAKWLDYHERAGWQYAPTLAVFLHDRTYEHEPPQIAQAPRRESAADEAFRIASEKIEKEGE